MKPETNAAESNTNTNTEETVKPVAATHRNRRHRRAEAHDVYVSASKHLNQVLEFDPEALVGPN